MKKATIEAFARQPGELLLVAKMLAFILFLPLMLRAYGIEDLVARITPRRAAPLGRRRDPARVAYLCERSLARLERFGLPGSCLRRCLVMYRFLRAEGVPVSIDFGALWEADALKGHSWLTLDGALYLEAREKVDRFVHFFSLPATETAGARRERAGRNGIQDLEKVHFD